MGRTKIRPDEPNNWRISAIFPPFQGQKGQLVGLVFGGLKIPIGSPKMKSGFLHRGTPIRGPQTTKRPKPPIAPNHQLTLSWRGPAISHQLGQPDSNNWDFSHQQGFSEVPVPPSPPKKKQQQPDLRQVRRTKMIRRKALLDLRAQGF